VLHIVADDSYQHVNQPANGQKGCSTKITHDETSAVRNVHILCCV